MEKERESDWTFRASDKSEQNFMGIPGPPHRWTEEELVAAAQNGDSSALEELLQQHRALLHGTVRRLMASADETDDVVQDAMLRAFMNIGRFRKEARFSSWLIAIGINSALSCRRRSNRVQLISLDEREATSRQVPTWNLRDSRPTPEQECLGDELREFMRSEIRKLPRALRSVVLTRHLNESSIEETARDLGITDAAVKGRLRRARLMLLGKLQQRPRARARVRRLPLEA